MEKPLAERTSGKDIDDSSLWPQVKSVPSKSGKTVNMTCHYSSIEGDIVH